MNKIHFITSNSGKIESLKKSMELCDAKVEIVALDLNLIEPQFDKVQDVSIFKAKQAFEAIKAPVLVEDGGLLIKALNDFPGVYTKYVLDKIGIDGILKLMHGLEDRRISFASFATYIDNDGKVFQFERQANELQISKEKIDICSPFAWSELWKIIYIKDFNKNLCQLSEQELAQYYYHNDRTGSLQNFAYWYAQNHK